METLSEQKKAFLALLLEVGALQFGAFTLKSGRISPYFFNSARFRTGLQLERLGTFYAEAITRFAPQATIVFGPSYKGIPLCISSAMALSRSAGRDIGYLFDRKEEKSHGDRGRFVGRAPEAGDRLVLVDDVITDGETKRQAVALLRETFTAPIDALVIAFNRMERDAAGGDAVRRFEDLTGVPVVSLLSLTDLESALGTDLTGLPRELDAGRRARIVSQIQEYRQRYGVA